MSITTIRRVITRISRPAVPRLAGQVRKSVGIPAVTAALLLVTVSPLQAAGAATDPGPAGSFTWKGFNWQKRFWGGAPQYNKVFDPANVSNPDARGYVTIGVSNPTGKSPAGAEFQSTRQGFGYGTYSTTVEKNVSRLQKEVVWGCLFTYDPDAAPGYNEIDLCEASAWGGGASYGESWPVAQGHGYWFDASKPPGAGNNTVDFAVTDNVLLTHRMVWAPGKLTFETYAGKGYAGTLLKRTVLNGSTVPVPARERVHFNLWVTGGGGGDPAHVKPEKVIIRDFSFIPAPPVALASAEAGVPKSGADSASAVPKISGAVRVGGTLTAQAGTAAAGTRPTYQWYRSEKPISGAVSSTYTLTRADLDRVITVRTTFPANGAVPLSGLSVPTASVRSGMLAATTPAIRGRAKTGYTLTARPGRWTSGATLKYQWFRSGVPVKGSVLASYRLTARDVGKVISVRITGNKAGYSPRARISAKTAVIAPRR